MRQLLPLLVAVSMLASCVPNRKIQLLQKGDVNQKNLKRNEVVRTYAVDTFSYKVQPNDIVSIRFESLSSKELDFFNRNINNQVGVQQQAAGFLLMGELVDEFGEVSLPVLGKVKVAGYTVFQLQDSIQKMASKYVESPVVRVRLLNFRITVLGEVRAEGTITLGNNRVSVLEALGLAGGLGDLADRSNVKLIRQKGGNVEVQYLNLLEEDFINSPYYYVTQGDVLIVPPLKQRPFRNYFGQNLGLFVSSLSVLLLTINLLQN